MTNSQQRPDAPSRASSAAGTNLRVVAIGGGTGLSTLLKGLKVPPALTKV